MVSRRITRRGAGGYLALLVLALLLSSLPAPQVRAATIDQMIDNDLGDFSDGIFQRAALSSAQDVTPELKDDIGAVQLAPSGKLVSWGSVTPLPEPLADTGFVALGKRLYAIGGTVTLTNTSTSGTTNAVYWATVTITDGNLLLPESGNAWQNPNPLPPTRYTDDNFCDTRLFAARSSAAVTSISTSGDAGYLYVIGGAVKDNGCNTGGLSSVAVQIGRVDANGAITWSNGPDIPSPASGGGIDPEKFGVQDAAVASIRTTTGKAFVYVFGGLERFQIARGVTPVEEQISRAVFFAEVNLADGSLGAWVRGPDIPIAVGAQGLFKATAIAGRFDVGGGSQATRDAIYLTGGQTKLVPLAADYNARIWRADVNPSTGALTWDDTPGEGDKPVALPAPAVNLAGVSFNSKLYVVGGAPTQNGEGTRLVPTSVFLEDMSLDEIDGLPNIFFQGGGSTDSVLIEGRQNHGVALVRAEATPEEPSAAWVYVAGGTEPDGDTTSSLFLGKIGGLSEADATQVASSGWYYSAPVNVRISNADANVLAVNWSTQIDRGAAPSADIKMEYRTTIVGNGICSTPGIFDDNSWQVITDTADPQLGSFFSTDGLNTYDFPDTVTATCFQYRALLSRTGGSVSPSLLNVSLKKIVPGAPDLEVKDLITNMTGGTLNSIEVVITNDNSPDITQPADFETRGSFFVDLCISAPNQNVAVPILPITVGDGPPCSKAYAQVSRSAMLANAEVIVRNWKYSSGPNKDKPVADLISLFDATGTYQLIVVIDAENLVAEGDTPTSEQEQNNIGPTPPRTITIDVVPPDSTLRLPLIQRGIP